MKNRIPALLLCIILAVSALAGCGRDVDPIQTTEPTTKATTAATEAATTETTEAYTPTAEDFSKYYEENGFLKGVTASDYIEVPDFSTFIIDKADLETTDEQIDEIIAGFMATYVGEEDYDKVIEEGDTVCIAYTGYVDGKTFSGGATDSSGTLVTIGVTNYIDDFLEQLIGHKPGDDLSIEVTFPDPYTSNTSLSGKDAVFETTILYVQTVPELTQEVMDENIDTIAYYFNTTAETPEELRTSIYDTFYSYYLSQEVEELVTAYMADVKVPQEAYDCSYNNTMLSILQYGTDVETYKTYYGYSDEDFENLVTEDAKTILLYQAIAEKEGWNITETELREYFQDNFATYRESMGMGYIAEYLIYSKATNLILDSVVIK